MIKRFIKSAHDAMYGVLPAEREEGNSMPRFYPGRRKGEG